MTHAAAACYSTFTKTGAIATYFCSVIVLVTMRVKQACLHGVNSAHSNGKRGKMPVKQLTNASSCHIGWMPSHNAITMEKTLALSVTIR